jgi:hypothetical protein
MIGQPVVALMGGSRMSSRKKDDTKALSSRERRAVLRRLGRFAAVSAPAVTLLLAAESKPASAIGSCVASCAVVNPN